VPEWSLFRLRSRQYAPPAHLCSAPPLMAQLHGHSCDAVTFLTPCGGSRSATAPLSMHGMRLSPCMRSEQSVKRRVCADVAAEVSADAVEATASVESATAAASVPAEGDQGASAPLGQKRHVFRPPSLRRKKAATAQEVRPPGSCLQRKRAHHAAIRCLRCPACSHACGHYQ
jgi:hypothetical protein